MRQLYILEAKWHDKINRVRHTEIVGVFNDLDKLENAKQQIILKSHEYSSVSFGVNAEIQPFHA